MVLGLGILTEPLAIARPLSWVIVLAFLGTTLLEGRDRERARQLAVAAWVLFAAFWLVLVPHFVLEQKSIVEGIGSIAAVPLSVYTGYLLWNGRDSLFLLTRAVGLMGLIYLPFAYLPFVDANPAREWIIETVAAQTDALLGLIGVEPELVHGVDVRSDAGSNPDFAYLGTFRFTFESAAAIHYSIIIACTGLGSMAIFAGAILAVGASWHRKARALAIAIPIIYAANLVRNVFIATMFGEQHMQWFVGPMMTLFGLSDPRTVSYMWADRILAQFGSVIALVIITWLVVRELPEILTMVEDLIYIVTNREVDLQGAFGMDDAGAGTEAQTGDAGGD